MGSIYYRKYILYKKRQINKKTTRNCKVWAKVMKEKYLRLKD